MDRIPGKHRLVFDTTTPAGFGAALAYANNFLTASKDGYGLNDQDHAIIIIARHFSTPYAYNDAMWAKYGKSLPPMVTLDDPKTKQRATINLFAVAGTTVFRTWAQRFRRPEARRALRRLPDGDDVFRRNAGASEPVNAAGRLPGNSRPTS